MTPPVALRTELFVNNAWTDVSTQTYERDGYAITRGRRSEGSTADPSTCTQTYNNRSGNFSPRNPVGAYFGSIGRNTRVRVSLPAAATWLQTTGATGDCATAPDNARLDVTGDIDLRADLWNPSWQYETDLIGKYTTAGNQRSYEFVIAPGGTLTVAWSADGITPVSATSTVPVPAPITGRRAVRATLDVNNGSGGYTVAFYTAATMAGPWTQLGDQIVTTGGTTSIFNSTTPLYVGDIAGTNAGYPSQSRCRFYSAKVLNGIGGSEVANPDFTAQTDGSTGFTDAAGNVWSLGGAATIVGRDWRFHGEVSEWPPARDTSDTDRYVQVTASGILRRLGKGAKPLKSVFYRAITSPVVPVTGLVGYWPCEDESSATSIASGLSGKPAIVISGTPILATDSTSFPGSAPLPTMGNASFTATIPTYAATGAIDVYSAAAIPTAGVTSGAVLSSIRNTGTAARWELVYTTTASGTVTLNAYDASGTSLLSTSVATGVAGTAWVWNVTLLTSGANVNWYAAAYSATAVTVLVSGTLAGASIGVTSQVVLAPNKDCVNITMGQLIVNNANGGVGTSIASLISGYNGETATARFTRLCTEEGITSTVIGDDDTSSLNIMMGPQGRKTLLDLLHECETADNGILYEPRDFFGLAYRTPRSLMSQAAALSLDYAAKDLSNFNPVEDDRYIVNDLTVSRDGGGSARYALSTGSLSTQDPPAGVGLYDASVTLVNALDADLPNQASWRVHLGTVDQPRHPALLVNLLRGTFTGNAAKQQAAGALDVGDRIVVANPPSDQPPDDISQLAIGMIERLNSFEHVITYVCQPESPYRVLVWGDSASRYSPAGSTLAADATSGATTLSVASVEMLWGFGDGAFDIMVGGERMTVTAVAGASSPQTLTVTRAVNGIVKAHSTGDAVTLFDPRYWSL